MKAKNNNLYIEHCEIVITKTAFVMFVNHLHFVLNFVMKCMKMIEYYVRSAKLQPKKYIHSNKSAYPIDNIAMFFIYFWKKCVLVEII